MAWHTHGERKLRDKFLLRVNLISIPVGAADLRALFFFHICSFLRGRKARKGEQGGGTFKRKQQELVAGMNPPGVEKRVLRRRREEAGGPTCMKAMSECDVNEAGDVALAPAFHTLSCGDVLNPNESTSALVTGSLAADLFTQ